MTITPEKLQRLDEVLAARFQLPAGLFCPTTSWDSLGMLMQHPEVMERCPSFDYDAEAGVWTVRLDGAQIQYAQRGGLLVQLCAVVARSFSLRWEDSP